MIFIHYFISILSQAYNEPIQRPAPLLIERYTGIAEVKGSNPVQA